MSQSVVETGEDSQASFTEEFAVEGLRRYAFGILVAGRSDKGPAR